VKIARRMTTFEKLNWQRGCWGEQRKPHGFPRSMKAMRMIELDGQCSLREQIQAYRRHL
jgi:hypothetical protein